MLLLPVKPRPFSVQLCDGAILCWGLTHTPCMHAALYRYTGVLGCARPAKSRQVELSGIDHWC